MFKYVAMEKEIEILGRKFIVYDSGTVVACPFDGGNNRKFSGGLMPQSETRDGYLRISFRPKCQKLKRVLVHRLVAEAFLESWDPSLTVDHIDGDKRNNGLGNLRMVTAAQNTRIHHNKRPKSDGCSYKFIGVYGNSGGFMARISVNGKKEYGGNHLSEIDAARAVNGICMKNNLPIYRYNTPLSVI